MNQITPIFAADCVFQTSRKIGDPLCTWKADGWKGGIAEDEVDLHSVVGDFFDAGLSRAGISICDRVFYVGGMSIAQTDWLSTLVGDGGELVVGEAAVDVDEAIALNPDGADQATFDAVYSAFGTMSFESPVAGLRTLRRMLKPGGRMTQVVWRDAKANPWISTATTVARRHLPVSTTTPSANDPFAMADRFMVEAQMGAAGFENVSFERVDQMICIAADAVAAVDFQMGLSPAREMMSKAGVLASVVAPHIRERLLEELLPYETEDGVWMDASAWIVTGENPV